MTLTSIPDCERVLGASNRHSACHRSLLTIHPSVSLVVDPLFDRNLRLMYLGFIVWPERRANQQVLTLPL